MRGIVRLELNSLCEVGYGEVKCKRLEISRSPSKVGSDITRIGFDFLCVIRDEAVNFFVSEARTG